MNFEDKTILVYDQGLYPFVAEKLAESFGRVLYFAEYRRAFPSSKDWQIGSGLIGVERIDNPWDYYDEIDLWIFPDVYHGPLQEWLRGQGKRVWGSGRAEELELNRWSTRQKIIAAGLPVPEATRVIGLSALRELLVEEEDLYVKVSRWRGDFETFHHVNYGITKTWIDGLEHQLGPVGATVEIVVESPTHDPEDTVVEVGYDGFQVGGVYPAVAAFGYERKDASYLGQVREYDLFPKPMLRVNEAFAKYFGDAACNFSNEIRIGEDQEPYLIDPCLRCGSPPSESYIEIYENWDEIFWEGSEGRLAEPIPKARYMAQIVLHSEHVVKDWLPIFYPKRLGPWVKIHNKCVVDGQVWSAPGGFREFGSVVAHGDSVSKTIDLVIDRAKEIQALDLEMDEASLEEALDAAKTGEGVGIDW